MHPSAPRQKLAMSDTGLETRGTQTTILKDIDYKFEVVIPVIPDNPPPNWRALSPTGLIPAMQDGDFTLADSTAICL